MTVQVSDILNVVRAEPTHANHMRAFEELHQADPQALQSRAHVRVAIVADFTAEPVARCFWVQMYLRGVWVDYHVTPSSEASQEVINSESDLYRFAPDVVLVMLMPERPGAEIESHLALLTALRSRVQGTVLVASFVASELSCDGPLDWQRENGTERMLQNANHAVADWARGQERVFVFDLAGLVATVGRERAFDERMRLVAQQPFATAFLPRLGAEAARYVRAITGPARKCLVLDLDHTLWGGILAEDGHASLRLRGDAVGDAYRQFQQALLALHGRGILLALCSRNDRDEAFAVLRDHPDMILRPEHIAAARIGFSDKVEGIRAIADELNIGLDALVFLDDDKFERQNVRDRLPEVLVPDLPSDPAFYRRALLALDAFDVLSLSAEDRARGQLYQERREREELHAQSASLEEYLASLKMEVTIVAPEGAARTRLFQLVHKTNRFNLTTRRYSEAEFAALIAAPDYRVFGVQVRDRLGDNGIVGLVVARFRGEACEIDTFLLSCRVMGRQIETAILAYVADLARARHAARLVGRYAPTAKNGNVRDLYERHGFQSIGADGETEMWEAPLDRLDLKPPVWAHASE